MPSKTIRESWHPGSPTWPRIGSAFNRVTDDATVARIQLPAKRCLMNHLDNQLTGGRARRQSRRPKSGGLGMRTWLEYDLVALAALVLGVTAVELLAFIIGG